MKKINTFPTTAKISSRRYVTPLSIDMWYRDGVPHCNFNQSILTLGELNTAVAKMKSFVKSTLKARAKLYK